MLYSYPASTLLPSTVVQVFPGQLLLLERELSQMTFGIDDEVSQRHCDRPGSDRGQKPRGCLQYNCCEGPCGEWDGAGKRWFKVWETSCSRTSWLEWEP
ncbi:hypothetical protein SAMD00023353_0503080 [Rosellinia necatrix]|uniref:Uncharacterized protein n=1 Tax=Rosellinia necatrix TaxID=77044 RepID=A0A1S7UKS9_ROSNE|nr:hypothetical protein SAMD00023353_0503080 [Rosellinia necatrix]